jgi:23S rRNA (pseudouridine1915-N3)-methyltransferase
VKIVLLCVGKLRSAEVGALCGEYLARLQRYGSAEVVEVRAARGAQAPQAVAEESEHLLKALAGANPVWVLDERGRAVNSRGLATRLADLEGHGTKRLTLVLGGAYGLDDRIRKRGELLALSPLTFPHELCRLILLEQLYRARTIQRGEPYHH